MEPCHGSSTKPPTVLLLPMPTTMQEPQTTLPAPGKTADAVAKIPILAPTALVAKVNRGLVALHAKIPTIRTKISTTPSR